jgi:ERCC4-related helicase
MEVEPIPTQEPLYASLPPDSPFRVDASRVQLPPSLVDMQNRTPTRRNYAAIIPRASDKALYLAMVLCQHAAYRKRNNERVKCLIIANTKPRVHEIVEQIESILPGVSIPILTGANKESITERLEGDRDIVLICTSGKFYFDVEAEVMKYNMCSLLLIDECHYAMWQTFLEAGLHKYIVDRVYRNLKPPLPQLVGVTSNPVERCDALDEDTMQRHLMKVASGVDSKVGIVFADDVISDTYVPRSSTKRVPKPVMSVKNIKVRNTQMDMVISLQVEICKWAEAVGLASPHYKWSTGYSEFVQTQLDAALASVGAVSDTTPPELAKRVSILELLRLYTQAIKALVEFGVESALGVLQAATTGTAAEATRSQLTADQYDSINKIKQELETLKARKSPLVQAVVDVVCAQINDMSTKSRGLLFVDSLQDAQLLYGEIHRSMFMCRPYVIPRSLVASYSTSMCSEIEKNEQTTEEMLEKGQEGLEAFSKCESRLLLIPYALEIDTVEIKNIESEFDFVARLHKVSRRDDFVESEHVLSFMLSPVNKTFGELRRDFDMCRLEIGLRALPTEKYPLKKKLVRGMEDVMFSHQSRHVYSLNRTKKQNEPGMDQIELRCKKCRVYVCHGMELFAFFVDGGNHCVVPHKDFHTRYHTKPYLAKHKVIKRVNRLQRMFCNNCGAPWGVVCHFPAKGCLLPVLKSKYFVFEMNRKYYAIKLWSDALFKVPPLTAYPKFHIHGTVEAEVK